MDELHEGQRACPDMKACEEVVVARIVPRYDE
jgi:hypothetical protein